MDGYKARFEHGRGHRMLLEGEPPIGSGEIDAIQYRMLRCCEISGLLALETEDLDGVVVLRYSLSGRRMLSQALRAARWTMEDAMTALCRLAEVLELSREYMLDLERYVLDDDFIFVGDGWHDLAFTYVPLWRQTASASLTSGIERLIVRWMMNVEAPDGTSMQHLLRMTSSPDFSPAQLRGYARQYLASMSASVEGQSPRSLSQEQALVRKPGADSGAKAESEAVHAARGKDAGLPQRLEEARDLAAAKLPQQKAGLRWPLPTPEREAQSSAASGTEFGVEAPIASKESWPLPPRRQEEGGTSEGLSGWLGAEPLWDGNGNEEQQDASSSSDASTRRRIWLLAGAAGVTAAVWRFAYLPHPSSRGLLLSFGVTLLAGAACFFLWDGKRMSKANRSRRSAGNRSSGLDYSPHWPQPLPRPDQERAVEAEAWAVQESRGAPERLPRRFGSGAASSPGYFSAGDYARPEPREEELEAGTSWLGSAAEGTRLLVGSDELSAPAQQYYLEWETNDDKRRIRLAGDSFIIGRSQEAAQHVDDTDGVSRAHLEIIRGAAAWQARDLGSRNGSWLNGVPMAPYEMYPLNHGDSIQIASSLYRYSVG